MQMICLRHNQLIGWSEVSSQAASFFRELVASDPCGSVHPELDTRPNETLRIRLPCGTAERLATTSHRFNETSLAHRTRQ